MPRVPCATDTSHGEHGLREPIADPDGEVKACALLNETPWRGEDSGIYVIKVFPFHKEMPWDSRDVT